MKKLFLLFVLLAFVQPCSAGLFLEPSVLNVSLFGGEIVEETFSVFGDFSVPVGVVLDAVVFCESGDSNGFVVSFDKNAFVLGPGEIVDVNVSFFAVSRIFGEKYVVELKAVALVDEPIVSANDGGSSGGAGGFWFARPKLPVDENVLDANVFDAIVPKEVESRRMPVPCVQEGEVFWHRECCEGLEKRGLTCELRVSDLLEESDFGAVGLFGLDPLFLGCFAGIFTLIFGGFIAGALFLLKEKKKKQGGKIL